jgi:hypothetical protein
MDLQPAAEWSDPYRYVLMFCPTHPGCELQLAVLADLVSHGDSARVGRDEGGALGITHPGHQVVVVEHSPVRPQARKFWTSRTRH